MLVYSKTSIQALLSESCRALKDSSSPMLDSEVLLAFCFNKNRSFFRAWPEKIVPEAIFNQFALLLNERIKGAPIAYLTAEKEFWSRSFFITADVLIPRPETELLVEIALALIPANEKMVIADLGTGSGIIAITLGLERPACEILAIDKSTAALTIAKKNAANLHTRNITFLEGSWLQGIHNASLDLIVSNPPYIDAEDEHLQQGDVKFEPSSALIADNQGLADFQLIIEQASNALKPRGLLVFEHGFEQHQPIQELFKKAGFTDIKTYQDLLGHPRVTQGQWNGLDL